MTGSGAAISTAIGTPPLSLVTLSTVGYGDILPITPQARMLAALEGIIGPLYLAVLIARLVGLAPSRHHPSA